MTLFQKIKFKYIEYLDKKDETICWTDSVSWAFGNKPFWSLFFRNHIENSYHTQNCRKYDKNYPWAYCNKCELNKRYYLPKKVEPDYKCPYCGENTKGGTVHEECYKNN